MLIEMSIEMPFHKKNTIKETINDFRTLDTA